MIGPQTKFADDLHAMKHRGRGEDFREAMNRIAFALHDTNSHYHAFREILLDMRFMPAGRVQTASGATRTTTSYNCLSGDTEIVTSGGFVALRDLEGKTIKILSPVSGDFENAVGKKYGKQELYRLVISNSSGGQDRTGSFEVLATKDHRWVLQDGSVTTSVKPGDLLRVGTADVDTDLDGFVHGFVFGDGSKMRDECEGGLRSNPAYAEDFKFKKFVVRMCGAKAVHLDKFLRSGRRARVTYAPSHNGDPCVMCFSSWDLKLLPESGKHSPEYLCGFVHGLLAADGCFSVREGESYVFHGRPEFVEWMRHHMVYAGYAPAGRVFTMARAGQETNYGTRNYDLCGQRFRPVSSHRGYQVLSVSYHSTDDVYCVEEPKYKQIVLRNGLSSGNCFASGTWVDSMVEGPGSIMDRLKETATTLRLGGGIGHDISTLRPSGDMVTKLDTQAEGPVGFLDLFNAVGDRTAGVGLRRGAQMAVMRVDHPDIEQFIHCKQENGRLKRFNISVAVTDEFMEAVAAGREFQLRFGGRTYRTVDAAQLWEKIMRSAWDWAEPGVFFVDTVNKMNNLYYCEVLACTNPCGEQPLPPHGACLLGSFNLVKYLLPTALERDMPRWYFDFDHLAADIPHVVRAMDNVVDRARYPLTEQRVEALNKRRMGLGVTGLANCIEACGFSYGSPRFVELEEKILRTIQHGTYMASAGLAREKGSFPYFDERFLEGLYFKTLDDDVQYAVKTLGLRNSHLGSIAPTGTISMVADNVSSGLEPVFEYETERPVETPDGKVMVRIDDYGHKFLEVRGKLSADVTVDEHINVLVAAQKYIDAAVSKTCNVGGDVRWEDFKGIYTRVYEGGGKGCTVFNRDGMRRALLERAGARQEPQVVEPASCRLDERTGVMECE